MLRSRVSSTIDTVRLSHAMSRPGIDPRIWVSYAVLLSEPYIETTDGQQDIVVDLQLMPTGEQETARVGAIYAGTGFGFYTPLHKDDEVLVCAPSGDPDEGLVVMQRLWSPADPPPQAVYDHPEDVTLVVQPGKNLRLKALGSGTTYITSESGKVVLGDENASKGVARLDDLTAGGSLSISAAFAPTPAPVSTLVFTYTPPGGGVPQVATIVLGVAAATPMSATLNLSGKIDSASDKVVAS